MSPGLKYGRKCARFVPKTCFQQYYQNFNWKYQQVFGKFVKISLQNIQNSFLKWFWAQIGHGNCPICAQNWWQYIEFAVLLQNTAKAVQNFSVCTAKIGLIHFCKLVLIPESIPNSLIFLWTHLFSSNWSRYNVKFQKFQNFLKICEFSAWK